MGTELQADYERLRVQLRLCEDHAATMARDFDQSLAVVQAQRDRFKKALLAYNDALRSTSEVAQRNGAETGWVAFAKMILRVLHENHKVWLEAIE